MKKVNLSTLKYIYILSSYRLGKTYKRNYLVPDCRSVNFCFWKVVTYFWSERLFQSPLSQSYVSSKIYGYHFKVSFESWGQMISASSLTCADKLKTVVGNKAKGRISINGCVSEGKKCSFFGKFGVLCFLQTLVYWDSSFCLITDDVC